MAGETKGKRELKKDIKSSKRKKLKEQTETEKRGCLKE